MIDSWTMKTTASVKKCPQELDISIDCSGFENLSKQSFLQNVAHSFKKWSEAMSRVEEMPNSPFSSYTIYGEGRELSRCASFVNEIDFSDEEFEAFKQVDRIGMKAHYTFTRLQGRSRATMALIKDNYLRTMELGSYANDGSNQGPASENKESGALCTVTWPKLYVSHRPEDV